MNEDVPKGRFAERGLPNEGLPNEGLPNEGLLNEAMCRRARQWEGHGK